MATELAPNSFLEQLQNYQGPITCFDEFRDAEKEITAPWKDIISTFQSLDSFDYSNARNAANKILQENGVNFTGIVEEESQLRPWEIDLLPVSFSEQCWDAISQGISQRAKLIESITHDLYGEGRLISSGLIPPELVFRNNDFHREFHELPKESSQLLLYGCELGRSSSGQWWILSDRSSAPSGISYAVENRIVSSETMPEVFHRSQIQRLAPFFVQLQSTIKKISSNRQDNPSVVILSAGPKHPFYFEDVFLAQYLGYTLVEAGDLTVRRNKVWIKTLGGLIPVDVLIRRTSDQNLDPLEINNPSPHGIAGLLQAIRRKNVIVANGPEFSLLDSPVFMPFLPKLCQELLGEELKIPSIATWWCGQKQPLEYVMDRFDDLVIKPAFLRSGTQEYIVNELAEAEKVNLRERIQKDPDAFVAQEKINRSTSPSWINNSIQPGHLSLRTFAVKSDDGFEVMKGGLVRVKSTDAPMRLSVSAGEFSKDVWVQSSTPVKSVSLLGAMQNVPRLKRANNSLPSRAADNLFWLGRYLERLEFSGRMLRKVTERLISESANQPIDDINPLISCLAKQRIIDESLSKEESQIPRAQLESAWPKIVWDSEDNRRLPGLLNEVERLASILRDRMSNDFWRAISQIKKQTRPAQQPNLGQLSETLNNLMLSISATTGQITDGLIIGPTRQFLMIGRQLERARQISFLLKEFLTHLDDQESIQLFTALDVCNSVMTYRSRYRANIALLPVFDLLVTEDANPHSIIYQFRELERHIKSLPLKTKPPQLPPELDLVRRILFQLESILPSSDRSVSWKDYRIRLEPALKHIELTVNDISDQLTEKYFVHGSFSQQIENTLRGESP